MRGSEFAELSAFLAIAERRSFARAAAHLGVSASALSQTMRHLETRLGVRLLNRTTRSVAATEAGEKIIPELRAALRLLERATDSVHRPGASARGKVRLTASRVATELLIAPRLRRLRQRHPEVELELSVSDRFVDIVEHGFDLGIRRREFLEADMVGRRLSGDERFVAVAAPAYLAQRSAPAVPVELRGHDCVRIRGRRSGRIHRWTFRDEGARLDVDVSGSLVVDDATLARAAAVDGAGVAFLAESFVRAAVGRGELVTLLERFAPMRSGFFLFAPPGVNASPSVLAVARFLERGDAWSG